MEDKNIFVPLGGERMRRGGAGCVRGDEMRMQEFFFFLFFVAVNVCAFLGCLCTSEIATALPFGAKLPGKM